MKSAYQFDSAQEMSPEIVEAIKTAFGDAPIQITIERLPSRKRNKKTEKASKNNKAKTDIAESVIDLIFDQINRKSAKKNKPSH